MSEFGLILGQLKVYREVSLHYSGRARKQEKVIAILNTVYYANGQKIPDVFAKSTVESSFVLPKDAKNVKLHYISTGHREDIQVEMNLFN